jgi:hypothetical protein
MLVVCAALVALVLFVDEEVRKRRAIRCAIEQYKRDRRRGER